MTQPGYPTPAPTNTLAIVALVLGFVFPIGGIICGHIALAQIKGSGEGGHGLALAGTIVGYVLQVLYIVLIVAATVIPILVAGLFTAGYTIN